MKATIKTYIVTSGISRREIKARNKKEAAQLFRQQLKGVISEKDKVIVK